MGCYTLVTLIVGVSLYKLQVPYHKLPLSWKTLLQSSANVAMVHRGHLRGLGRLQWGHLCLLITCRQLSSMPLRDAMCWPWLTGQPVVILPSTTSPSVDYLVTLVHSQFGSRHLLQFFAIPVCSVPAACCCTALWRVILCITAFLRGMHCGAEFVSETQELSSPKSSFLCQVFLPMSCPKVVLHGALAEYACKCRSLGAMSVQQAASLSRDELESGLSLLALLLFRNELKPDTTDAVQSLKRGQVSAAELCCAVLCCAEQTQIKAVFELYTKPSYHAT